MHLTLLRAAQITRFCIAGAAGVISFYAALYFCTEHLGIWYIASSIIGFILNNTVNFILQKFWTFRDTETRRTKRQAVQYLTMSLCILGANTLFLYLAVQYLHMSYLKVQIFLTLIFTVVSYLISQKIFVSEKSI